MYQKKASDLHTCSIYISFMSVSELWGTMLANLYLLAANHLFGLIVM